MNEPNGYLVDAAKHLELQGSLLDLADFPVRGKVQRPKALKAYIEHIRKRYGELSKPQVPLSPYERENGYLKRATYALTKFVDEEGGLTILEDIVLGQNKGWTSHRGPKISDNPFHWMLAAVFPDNTLAKKKEDKAEGDEKGKTPPMFPQQRNHFARQLLYADRHNVPTEHLIGFLYQSGRPSEITRKLKENIYEPWADPSRMAEINKHKGRGAVAFRPKPRKHKVRK